MYFGIFAIEFGRMASSSAISERRVSEAEMEVWSPLQRAHVHWKCQMEDRASSRAARRRLEKPYVERVSNMTQ